MHNQYSHQILSTLELVDTKNYYSTVWIGFSFHFEVKLLSAYMQRKFTQMNKKLNFVCEFAMY